MVLVVKNLPDNTGDPRNVILSLRWEDPLEKEMATYSSILAWKIPWKRSLVSYSPCGLKESDPTGHAHTHTHTHTPSWEKYHEEFLE